MKPYKRQFAEDQKKTYFAVVRADSRNTTNLRKVKMDFPSHIPLDIVASVLAEAGYFTKRDAIESFKDYLEDPSKTLQFQNEIDMQTITHTGTDAGWVFGEEFNMGFGPNPAIAKHNFMLSENPEVEDAEGDW